MVSLHDNLHTFRDLCQHRIGITGEFGFANVERSHITIMQLWGEGLCYNAGGITELVIE